MRAVRRLVGRLRNDESGQMVILILGFAVIVALLVTVVANASKAFLFRRSLSSWADGAAVVAAQSVSEEAVYTGQVADVLPLSQSEATAAVRQYVVENDLSSRFDGFRVAGVTVDGDDGTVTVTFDANVSLVFVNDIAPEYAGGVPISASATAVAPLTDS
jgi:hypothetical protein